MRRVGFFGGNETLNVKDTLGLSVKKGSEAMVSTASLEQFLDEAVAHEEVEQRDQHRVDEHEQRLVGL